MHQRKDSKLVMVTTESERTIGKLWVKIQHEVLTSYHHAISIVNKQAIGAKSNVISTANKTLSAWFSFLQRYDHVWPKRTGGPRTIKVSERTVAFGHSFVTVRSAQRCPLGGKGYYELEILESDDKYPQYGFAAPAFERMLGSSSDG